jgi:hypothetical protein
MNFNQILKDALNEAANWAYQITESECKDSTLTYAKCREKVVSRIFEKYKLENKTILIADKGFIAHSVLDLIKEHGKNIVVISPEELLKKGISQEMFNTPAKPMTIQAPPPLHVEPEIKLKDMTFKAPINAIIKKKHKGPKY